MIHPVRYLIPIGCLITLLTAGCGHRISQSDFHLASINIINQDGLSETISNQDRLKQYQNIDYTAPQPYQKILRVFNRNAEGDILACITSYHPNGLIKQYLDVNNGRAFGTYKEWYADGTLKIDATVIGGEADITCGAEKTWLFDGCSRAWDENGNLAAEIFYANGSLQGTSLYYHPNGTIWKKAPYDKNVLSGVQEIFYEDGRLLQTTEYRNGIREGRAIRYWDQCLHAAEEDYVNGLLTTGRYVDMDGHEVSRIDKGNGYRAVFGKKSLAELQEYRKGVMEGEVKLFSPCQRLLKLYHLKNGVKHGEEIDYHNIPDQLLPKLSVNWYDGKIQGIVKTWYDSGAIESQREMSNNTKHGLSTAWYSDGNLMLMEEYDHNKLVRGEYLKKGDRYPISTVCQGKGVVTLYDSEGNFITRIPYENGAPSE